MLLSWLKLTRAPNVFTAFSDAIMGYAIVRSASAVRGDWLTLLALLGASGCLYTAGIVLNDYFDYEIDLKERPKRPLPAGEISLGAARFAGLSLLLAGVVFAMIASWLNQNENPHPWRTLAIAVLLSACIIGYNASLKATVFGPVAMGGCRFFNSLLAMSAAHTSGSQGPWLTFPVTCWVVASGMGIYVTGVTWFSRQEATRSRSMSLVMALSLMLVGVFVVGTMPCFRDGGEGNASTIWSHAFLLFLVSVRIFWRGMTAVADPSPEAVQATVKLAVQSILFLNATLAFSAGHHVVAIGIFLLALPMLFLGRWIYST